MTDGARTQRRRARTATSTRELEGGERRTRARGEDGRTRVLVLYKKSAFQIHVKERENDRMKALLARNDPAVRRLVEAHDDHVSTLMRAREVFAALGAKATFRYRGDTASVAEYDLLVTFGGDGTLLMGSHLVGPQVPALGINTAPKDSVGFFCGGTKDDLEETLRRALEGSLRRTTLTRMKVTVDGAVITRRVLNDVLFCHASPAATSRYILRVGAVDEDQKSSGLWVGPAAGSTAGQRSAGGRLLPLSSEALQYVVREPYEPRGVRYALRIGVIEPGEKLVLVSKMRHARLFVDGPQRVHELDIGSTVELARSEEPLVLLGLRGRR